MAIAYQSFAETAIAAAGSVVITKPTGLAVGDHMFAEIVGGNGGGGAAITPPAGWTTYYNDTPVLSSANIPCAVFYKEADSADVAASDFTFTLSAGGTQYLGGGILRISGYGIIDGNKNRVSSVDTTGTVSYASDIDPVFPDALALLFLFGGDNANVGNITLTTPAIATDNPTWTQRAYQYSNVSGLTMLGKVYTAPRAAATAFGNISFEVDDGTGSGVGTVAIMLNLAPKISGSHTVVTGTSYFVNHPFLRTGTLTLDGVDPDTTSVNKTQWTNQSKPAVSDVHNVNKP